VKEKILNYEQEIIRMEKKNEEDVQKMKTDLDDTLKETIEKLNENLFQKFDGEKQELFEQIKMLKLQLARAKGKKDPELNFTNHMGLFSEGASGLSFIDDPEDDKDHLINKLHNELSLLTREYREAVSQMENYKFLSIKAEKDREYLVRRANNYRQEMENIRRKYMEFQQGAKNYEKEKMVFEKAYNVCSSFVESLEEEVDTLRSQFKLLEGMIPEEKLLSFQKQSPFTIMKKRSDMAKHTVNNKAVNMINKMFQDTHKSEGTITELCGIDKEIHTEKGKIADMKIPMFDFTHQTSLFKHVENTTQTNLTVENIDSLEEKVHDLEEINQQLDKGNLIYEEQLQKAKQEVTQKDKQLQKATISSKERYFDSDSQISDNEGKDKVFLTEEDQPRKGRKSVKSKKKFNTTLSSNSNSKSRTKSKYGSIEGSNSPAIRKKNITATYVYCKDCKRRRIKRKGTKTNPDILKSRKTRQPDMKKIKSTKLLRSQSSMLAHALKCKTDDEDESDFKLDESIYSKASFDSVHSWRYGRNRVIFR
jgi:hypothetical protein